MSRPLSAHRRRLPIVVLAIVCVGGQHAAAQRYVAPAKLRDMFGRGAGAGAEQT